MNLWRRLKSLAGGGKSGESTADPLGGVRWISANDNPFGVDILDCSELAQSMTSTTQDPQVAESYARLRESSGAEHRGHAPADPVALACELRYPHKGATRDGPLFKSEEMEDKWDIYLYENHLYFSRSWTGNLVFRAAISFGEAGATVTLIEAPREMAESNSSYPVAVVDFLIRSHLHRQVIPHPLPDGGKDDPQTLALSSFIQFGRYGLFGTRADTTRLRPPTQEPAGGPDV